MTKMIKIERKFIENSIRKYLKDEDLPALEMVIHLCQSMGFLMRTYNITPEAFLKGCSQYPELQSHLTNTILLMYAIQKSSEENGEEIKDDRNV